MPKSRGRRKKRKPKPVKARPGLSEDVREAIERFDREASEIVDAFEHNFVAASPPATIYHYTSEAGLRGIIESGKLWFGDIFDQNDPRELRHGVGAALDAMTIAAATGPPELKLFAKHMRKMLEGAVEKVAHFFICCFSFAGDDLGQWRAYADNGRGYALGFATGALEQAFARAAVPGSGNSTFPLSYSEDQLREMQERIVSGALPLLSMPRSRVMERTDTHALVRGLSLSLSMNVLRAALFFKHPGYTHEQEYRFLQLFRMGPRVPNLKYRGRPPSLRRYREFDWRKAAPGALTQVTLGPAADAIRARQFAADCLRKYHATPDDVSIEPSIIPYRVL